MRIALKCSTPFMICRPVLENTRSVAAGGFLEGIVSDAGDPESRHAGGHSDDTDWIIINFR